MSTLPGYVFITMNGVETPYKIPDDCTCPVPRNSLHLEDCPHWAFVMADMHRVAANHAAGLYDD